MKTWKLLLLCLALIIVNNRAEAQVAHLTLASDPGDFIGQGGTYDIIYTPSNSTYFSIQTARPISSVPSELHFVLGFGQNTPFTTLDFGTYQLGIPMQPGVYTNAQRDAFAASGHPGLDVSFQNRGSNTLTGQFTVTNFVYSSTAGLQSFAVSFEQHSEGATPALRGTFTYSAVPEPGTMGLCACSLLAAAGWRARRKARRAQAAS